MHSLLNLLSKDVLGSFEARLFFHKHFLLLYESFNIVFFSKGFQDQSGPELFYLVCACLGLPASSGLRIIQQVLMSIERRSGRLVSCELSVKVIIKGRWCHLGLGVGGLLVKVVGKERVHQLLLCLHGTIGCLLCFPGNWGQPIYFSLVHWWKRVRSFMILPNVCSQILKTAFVYFDSLG